MEITKELNFDSKKVIIVDIDEVRPNEWNPKDENTPEYQRVKLSIETNGLRLPVVVREKDGYEIIDGEQRWRACKDLNYPKVIIYNEGELSDQKAKELTIWYQQQVPFNEVDLAHLVKDLVKDKNLQTPFSKDEIDEYLKMASFNMEDFKEVPVPDFPTDEVITFSLPVTREQLKIIEQALDKCVKGDGEGCTRARAMELIMADYLAGE